jgi:hypothetical protein
MFSICILFFLFSIILESCASVSQHLQLLLFGCLCSGRSAVIGELDETLDGETDWQVIRADALKPVVH